MQHNPGEIKACKICGNAGGNRIHVAKEVSLGLLTEFLYLECGACGSLELESPPADIARYYPTGYYSFDLPTKDGSLRAKAIQILRRIRNQSYFGKSTILGRILELRNPHSVLQSFSELRPAPESRILDVGCGSGSFLLELHDLGFKNVLGVDPFIVEDIEYRNGVKVLKRYLSELPGTEWDIIMFHHSLEHVPDPVGTLRCAAKMLADGGQCLIRIPVVSWAWETYGVNWVQLDAPRHFFLPSEKGLGVVAQRAGLAVRRVEYDSDEFQFWGSELVLRNIPVSSVNPKNLNSFFPKRELQEFGERSKELNRQHRGDQAVFYLTKVA